MNELSFTIEVDTDTSSYRMHPMLLNRFESSDAELTNISHTEIDRFDKTLGTTEFLTLDELRKPGCVGQLLRLANEQSGTTADSKNTNGYFSIDEMVNNIVEFEKKGCRTYTWFGGVDAHHVFYEGISLCRDGSSYNISLGS